MNPYLLLVGCSFLFSAWVVGETPPLIGTPFEGGSGEPSPLILPPYEPDQLEAVDSQADVAPSTIPQLRTLLVTEHPEETPSDVRWQAARTLIKGGDGPTIARFAYAFKQGNAAAIAMLYENPTLQMIPYLLEEVAHGNMDHLPDYETQCRYLRIGAGQIVGAAFAKIPGLPEETQAWLHDLARRNWDWFSSVSERSKALLDWWEHNQAAVLAGDASKADWLPAERNFPSTVSDQWQQKIKDDPPLPPYPEQPRSPGPPPALPLQPAEYFEVWYHRVSDPQNLDLTYVPVDYGAMGRLWPKYDSYNVSLAQLAAGSGAVPTAQPREASVPRDTPQERSTTFTQVLTPMLPWIAIPIAGMFLLWWLLKRNLEK